MVVGEAKALGSVEAEPDPRWGVLRAAVLRLRTDLDGYRSPLADREVAERELSVLEEATRARQPDGGVPMRALLLIVAAVGSVSALAPAVAELREAVELFGVPRYRIPTVRRASY